MSASASSEQKQEIYDEGTPHSADSFKISDPVAATSDFFIGGALVVEEGSRGTVICHGERPDGSIGVSVHFHARNDGNDANVLCKPHQVQVVEKPAQAQPLRMFATSLQDHLGHAWENIESSAMHSVSQGTWAGASFLSAIAASCRHRLCPPSISVLEREIDGVGTRSSRSAFSKDARNRATVSGRTVMGKPGSGLRRRKTSDIRPDDGDDLFDTSGSDDNDDTPSETSQQPRWHMFIVILVLLNLSFGLAHLQRRARRARLVVVKSLTDVSFSDHISSHPDGTFVNFYFPSCKPCAKLAPEFEEAARQVSKTSGIPLVTVNADDAPSVLKQFSVNMFPSLLWFRQGKLVRAADASVRDSASIIEFVEESLQPAVIVFGAHDELDEAVPQLRSVMSRGKTSPVVVGFGRDPAVFEVMEEMAEKFRGLTAFIFVKKAQEGDPFMRLYFQDAETDKEYNAGLKVEDVQAWLEPFMSDGVIKL
jgi:thiol-disulfide isomerase/thioredoxin